MSVTINKMIGDFFFKAVIRVLQSCVTYFVECAIILSVHYNQRQFFLPVQVIWVTVGKERSDILRHFLVRENVPQAISGHH